MNSYAKKTKFSRKLLMVLIATLMLVMTIVPMNALADSAEDENLTTEEIVAEEELTSELPAEELVAPIEDNITTVPEPAPIDDNYVTSEEEPVIAAPEPQSISALGSSEIGALSSVTNGGVKLEISDYDGLTGWENGAIKKISVTADWGVGDTSSGKSMKITIPEGFRITQISTSGTLRGHWLDSATTTSGTTGVDTSILTAYDNDSSHAKSITSMILPKKETNALGGSSTIGSTYGTVELNFTNITEKIAIDIYARIDPARYYKPMTMPAPISAEAFNTDGSIGATSQSVDAVGDKIGSGVLTYSNGNPTTQLEESEAGNLSIGYTSGARPALQGSNNTETIEKYGVYRRFVKEATYYIYYPQGTVFDSLLFASGGTGTAGTTYTLDTANSRIVYTETWTSYRGPYIKYILPLGVASGSILTNPEFDRVEVKYWDDTTETITSTVAKNSVKVNPLTSNAKLTLSKTDTFMDNSIANVYSGGGYFGLKNLNSKIIKDQVVEFDFGTDWMVSKVNIPYDNSVSPSGITSVEYKTNLDAATDPWHVFDITKLSNINVKTKGMSKSDTSMAAGEYFKQVRAKVGDFSGLYTTGAYTGLGAVLTGTSSSLSIASYGKMNTSVTYADVTMHVYKDGDYANKQSTIAKISDSALLTKTSRSNASISYRNSTNKTTLISSVEAGNSFNVRVAGIGPSWYLYQTSVKSTTIKNPELYIRVPNGMNLDISSIEITDGTGALFTEWTLEPSHTSPQGDTMYVIKTNTVVGYYFGEEASNKTLTISYNLDTEITFNGNFTGRDLFAFGKDGYQAVLADSLAPVIDIYDFDGDSNTTETLYSMIANNFSVTANEQVLVQTYLSLAGEEPKATYNGDDATTAFFTPGTDADYTFKVLNNSPSDATYTAYIPIPKTSKSFGSVFQSEAFNWDIQLKNLLPLQTGFTIDYATNATEANYRETGVSAANWTTSPGNLADVNMIRLTAYTPLPNKSQAPNNAVEFKIPLRVNETFETATAGDKISKRNVWNPEYVVDSETFRGPLNGTKAGAELVIAEISGTVFEDKNADGLYLKEATDGDLPVPNHEVKLYKLDTVDNTYKPVNYTSGSNIGQQITTMTNANGVYLFDHSSGLGYGTYAVEFVENGVNTYEYTINNWNSINTAINSDAIIKNDLPNVGDTYRGWVLDIDATKPEAKTIGCGFLKYYPPVDLTLDLDNAKRVQTVKVGSNINLSVVSSGSESEITPDFWENIADPNLAYTWELVDPTDSEYVTLSNIHSKTVNIAGVKKTYGKTKNGKDTVTLKLTIQDVYGNIVSSNTNSAINSDSNDDLIEITVNTNITPTINLPTLDMYVGDAIPTNWLDIVSAVDDNGVNITLSDKSLGVGNTDIDATGVPVSDGKYDLAGTYGVTYEVTDDYGNIANVTLKIKVNGVPVITAADQNYRLGLGDTAIDTAVLSAATASYEKASDTIGAATIPTGITPTYAITSGEANFSTAGAYAVEYSATVASPSKTVTEPVTVNVVAPVTVVFDTKGNTNYSATSGPIVSQEVYAADTNIGFTVTGADTISVPTPPTKNGQTFKGWYYRTSDVANTDSSAWTLWNFATTLDKLAQVASDTDNNDAQFTLHAAYTYEDNNITYDLTAGGVTGVTNGSGNPAKYSTGMSSNLSLAAPSRAGYTFAGWTVVGGFDKNGISLDSTAPNTALTIAMGSYGDITLTPTWTAIDYSITYTLNGGSNDAANPATYNADVLPITIADATRVGYTFVGWTSSELGIAAATKNPVVPASQLGAITLTAHWSVDSTHPTWARVSFDANGGTGAPAAILYNTNEGWLADGVTFPSDIPSRTGYAYANWNTASDGSGSIVNAGNLAPTTDTVLYASWNANGDTAYKVEHYQVDASGNASLKETVSHTAATDTTASATAKIYAHYTLDNTHSSAVISGNVAGDGSLVLKLYYAINKHTVNYKVTGTVPSGAPSAPASVTVAYGSNVNVASILKLDGYTFSGWTASGISGKSFSMPDSDVTFTGSWKKNAPPIVTPPEVNPPAVNPPATVNPPEDPADETPETPEVSGTEVVPNPNNIGEAQTPKTTPTTRQKPGQKELVIAAKNVGIPTIGFGENAVPLVGVDGYDSWSLVDLILVALSLILFVIALMRAIIRRRSDNEFAQLTGKDAGEASSIRPVFLILSGIAAVASLIVLLSTQDLSQPIAVFDGWSAPITALFAASVVTGKLALSSKAAARATTI